MLRRNGSVVIHARAWLAATWLESDWLNHRSATWLKTMGFELRPFITTTDLHPHLNNNLH